MKFSLRLGATFPIHALTKQAYCHARRGSLVEEGKRKKTHVQKRVESVVNDFDLVGSEALNAVVAELFQSNDAIAVDVHHFEVGLDESTHRLQRYHGKRGER
jgi:hypothetical protein